MTTTKRRRAVNRENKRLRRKWRIAKGTWPARSQEYRRWIASQPCIICGGPSECAHVGPVRGLAQKCSDYETVPLCREHHRTGRDSVHTLQKLFWNHHGISREKITNYFREQYVSRETGGPE